MKALTAFAAFAVAVVVPPKAVGQVPARFLGTWVVDAEATASTIAADPNMDPENKPGWTERWLSSGTEVEIAGTSITFRHLEGATFDLAVSLEDDSGDRTLLSAVLPDPSRQQEMKLSVELRLDQGGRMNLRIGEENDFDLVVWQRSDDAGPERRAPAFGDAIDYLDSLKSCGPGEFRFSYPGIGAYHQTILGWEDDRCRVRSEHTQFTVMCDFSAETIELLTSDAKYEEARSGILSGSTDSEESRRMAEECRAE